MCYLSKLLTTSRFVPLFLAHGDVVVGFAIFHIVLFQKEKEKEKKALLHRKWMLVGTRWNRLAMVCERKRWGGVPSFIKEHQIANLSLKNLLHFCMEDSKNPIASRWQKQPPLKTQVLSLFYKWKALAHAQSMLPSAKGLSFTFMLSLCFLPLCTV